MCEVKIMSRTEIMDTIRNLSHSSGRYARLYNSLRRLQEYEPDSYEVYMNHLVLQRFKDPVDLVMFFES